MEFKWSWNGVEMELKWSLNGVEIEFAHGYVRIMVKIMRGAPPEVSWMPTGSLGALTPCLAN